MVLPIAFDGRHPRQGWGVCLFEGLALAASISLAGAMGPAPAAAAVLVTLDSGVWSVAAITASLSDPGFESLITLDHMPWLGQKSLAGQFAAAVGLALGQGQFLCRTALWARLPLEDGLPSWRGPESR